MDKVLQNKISEFVAPIIKILGYELWGCELLPAKKRMVLRIFIDSSKGISLEDCAKVSYQLSGALDVENLIVGDYELEVSSPGLDRLLFNEEQYQKFEGHSVQLKLRTPQNGRRNYVGEIATAGNGKVNIVVDGQIFVFQFTDIEKAKIIPKAF